MPKVLIVNGNAQYENMFTSRGWGVTRNVNDKDDVDLIQFTGGSDVSPSLYNEQRHPETYPSPSRDEFEKKIFEYAFGNNIPMAGICRGGQFLNVMNGGKMWQDVNGHLGQHSAFAIGHIGWVNVSSTHHQMMRPNNDAEYLLLMSAKESSRREDVGPNGVVRAHSQPGNAVFHDDVEAIYYPNTLSLCFQPHPEFGNVNECRDVYFYFLNNYLMAELNIEAAVIKSREAWNILEKSDEVE